MVILGFVICFSLDALIAGMYASASEGRGLLIRRKPKEREGEKWQIATGEDWP